MDPHRLLIYVHILLFVFWLGTDIGVYYSSRYTTEADLDPAVRMRFLKLALVLDMGPHTGLVLILPVGLQLAANLGLLTPPVGFIPAMWVVGALWLALVWRIYLYPEHPLNRALTRLDWWFRVVVIVVMLATGVASLAFDEPFQTGWLSVKAILFACVVLIGLILRSTIDPWLDGLHQLSVPGQREQAEQQITAVFAKASRWAMLLWSLVVVLGFLGTVKP